MSVAFLHFTKEHRNQRAARRLINTATAGRSLRELYVAFSVWSDHFTSLLCELLHTQRALDVVSLVFGDTAYFYLHDDIAQILNALCTRNQRYVTLYLNGLLWDVLHSLLKHLKIGRIGLVNTSHTSYQFSRGLPEIFKKGSTNITDIALLGIEDDYFSGKGNFDVEPHKYNTWFSLYCENPPAALAKCVRHRPVDEADIAALFAQTPQAAWPQLDSRTWLPKLATKMRANWAAQRARKRAVALVFFALKRTQWALGRDMVRLIVARLRTSGWEEWASAQAAPTDKQRQVYAHVCELAAIKQQEWELDRDYKFSKKGKQELKDELRALNERYKSSKRTCGMLRAQQAIIGEKGEECEQQLQTFIDTHREELLGEK